MARARCEAIQEAEGTAAVRWGEGAAQVQRLRSAPRSPAELASPRAHSSQLCRSLAGAGPRRCSGAPQGSAGSFKAAGGVPRGSTGGIEDGDGASAGAVVGDAMLEGFYQGVTLCEKVVRSALHTNEHHTL